MVRGALADREAWLVGGYVRDRLLGRSTADLDLAVAGDPESAARAIAATAGGAAVFRLSDAFGSWRVVVSGHAWQADVSSLQGETIEDDLRTRDLTINSMATTLAGRTVIDPTGGAADLEARVARAASPTAFSDDPVRCLRAARFACELDLVVDPATATAARVHADGIAGVAAERVFAELKRVVASPRPRAGIELADELGALQVVAPELVGLKGVQQNRFHHADVWTHTLEVLDAVVALQVDPASVLGGEHAGAVAALLAEPLADEITRGTGLRLGALLHDAAKPPTRRVAADGTTIGFPGHDAEGETLTRQVLTRLRASERTRAHVAALTRHHLRLGFLVHEQPLGKRSLFRYLTATDPVEVDVTLLSVADRLATRGDRAEESISRHLTLAREVLGQALLWRAGTTRPVAPVRGDELARELDLPLGPEIGRLLREIAEAQYAGEVTTRQEAVAVARSRLAGDDTARSRA